MRRQEMDIKECERLLLNKIRQIDPQNAEEIVGYIVSSKPLEILRYSAASDDQIYSLIAEAMTFIAPHSQQFPQLPPLQPPSWDQPQFYPGSSSHRNQAPVPPIGQIGPLHHGHPWFYPSSSFQGIQAIFSPIGPTGAFQSSYPEFIGSWEHFQSLSTPGGGMPSNHFLNSLAHVGEVHTLESLPMLGKEIREILFSLRPPRAPIKHLANMYNQRCGKPLLIEGFPWEGQQNGKAGCSLKRMLEQINTIRLIKRHRQHWIVPVEDAYKLGSSRPADDSALVLAPANSGSKLIFIHFFPESTFTFIDAQNYFRTYGPVTYVHIPRPATGRKFGFVSFRFPETVELILSERTERTPHFICGQPVFVEPYKEKHEREKFAQEDARSNSGAQMASDAVVIHEPHKGDTTAESSHAPDRLDEASEAQNSDDFGLPDNLDIDY